MRDAVSSPDILICIAEQCHHNPTKGGISPLGERFHLPQADFTPRSGISPFRRPVFHFSTLPKEGLPHQSAALTASPRGEAIFGSHCAAMLPSCLLQKGISCPEGVFHAAVRQYFMPAIGRYFIFSPFRRKVCGGIYSFLGMDSAV